MKRSVVKLGPATLVVSLPKKWTKQWGITDKDELDVSEQGKRLVVQTEKDKSLEMAKVDLDKLGSIRNFALVALYQRGVDEVAVEGEASKISKLTTLPLPELMGWEIVEQQKNKAIIKDLSGTKELDLNNLIRRVFLLLLSLSEETLNYARGKEVKTEHLLPIDLHVNRFSNLCLRILNKKGAQDHRSTPVMFALINQLESIGDEYKKLAVHVQKNKLKLDKNTIRAFDRCEKLLRGTYELYFSFSQEKAAKLDGIYRDTANKDLEKWLSCAKPKQLRALLHAQNVLERTIDFVRLLLISGL